MIIFWIFVSALWAMSIWGGWAEKCYEKMKLKNYPWYWLDVLKIEKTDKNCILFIKVYSAIGAALLTIITAIAI